MLCIGEKIDCIFSGDQCARVLFAGCSDTGRDFPLVLTLLIV